MYIKWHLLEEDEHYWANVFIDPPRENNTFSLRIECHSENTFLIRFLYKLCDGFYPHDELKINIEIDRVIDLQHEILNEILDLRHQSLNVKI
ncbi:MAG: hypothetical protein NZM43_13700, partial [Saprospiraceae bacterium]|nr:hypothetical protein [Saprospiraceae bacterium]MDW8485369.1 hypothetical protein [Saprospiraceae bacterium]